MSARPASGGADRALLERLAADLHWPAWEREREAQVAVGSARGPDRAPDVIAEALARARPVAEGGAYTWVDSDAVGPAGADPAAPLAGFTFAVKDAIAVAGRPLRVGSAVRADAPPEPADASVVRSLRAAGATLIGATALHELAFGVTGVNAHTGTPANPHDPERIPGGSSSGSAVAVAEGSARVALGTDTGGSIRIPAAFCGVVGFKPAYGSYSLGGVFPLAPTLDHVGLLARSVADVVAVHRALGRPVPSARAVRLRIGVAPGGLDGCDPEVAERVAEALAALGRAGCELVETHWPSSGEAFAPTTAIMFAEGAAVHRTDLERRPELFGADVRARLETGQAIPAPLYVSARRKATELRSSVGRALADIDVMAEPTVPLTAPTLLDAADPALPPRVVARTRLGNVVGVPVLSLPLPGPGLPVGLQLSAVDEVRLLAAAAYVERELS